MTRQTSHPAGSALLRWKLATPLIGLSLLMVVPAVFGTVTWWSFFGVGYRVLSVVICLILTAQLAVAVSIGVRPSRDVPWTRVGLVILGMLVACGLARIRYEF
ncbi:hypothetical protein [Micromonospora sp. WMMD1155]|uniref:hypothetical protein n=1 Tax=Micromonospora sp. WMMD1155 TaxID=3016094 RepID=UPI002499D7DF|nr:hypothetical protein [Micromonospora sp. WMMD1155]WFE53618.1 hypothetical protein O7617_26275 [Micromonospora sp. WMMD1155]